MGKINTYLDFGDLGEQNVIIYYNHQPREAATLEDPGCNEAVEIESIFWNNKDITSYLTEGKLSDLGIDILELLHDDGD